MGTLAWLHGVPGGRQGQLLLSVLPMVLIRLLCWAWECSDNSSDDDMAGLAGPSSGLLCCCAEEAAAPVGAWANGL